MNEFAAISARLSDPKRALLRTIAAFAVAAVLVTLALLRAPDHDESQYVAAAVLVAHGLLPYRDFAYLQTPLQPLAMAPVVALAGYHAWLALRVVNALLGGVVLIATHTAARVAGASRSAALAAVCLMATCDIFLFSIGTARNDIMPAALLALAMLLLVGSDAPSRWRAVAIGVLLAAAAAAKISYAIPALAIGLWSLMDRRRRPLLILTGALPIGLLCAGIAATAPAAAWFEVIRFPSAAPAEYYLATGRAWKLDLWSKLFDLTKFMLLGPALLGLTLVGLKRPRAPSAALVLLMAGLVAAALPTPTWRQYLLPALPPLFVLLACGWTRQTPSGRVRVLAAMFSVIGTAPTLAGAVSAEKPFAAIDDAHAVNAALDRAGYDGPVATLAPQFLPAADRLPDLRFATGPFYFRSRGLLPFVTEQRLRLLGHDRLPVAPLPDVVMVGGEDAWTSGERRLDMLLEVTAIHRGYIRLGGNFGQFRIYVLPRSR